MIQSPAAWLAELLIFCFLFAINKMENISFEIGNGTWLNRTSLSAGIAKLNLTLRQLRIAAMPTRQKLAHFV
jgi:hypothetical protein